mmetsp:Transcript_47375/g.94511  ORF Transcript_47375/g.94511 Transcript_47375/m.94511 type:complete len:102 (+) Transcript_47375:793-1098(+)
MFGGLPTANVNVPQQQNSYDCGVYMLKYIQLIAEHAPDFGSTPRPQWREHVELDFQTSEINKLRKQMAINIRDASEVQQAEKAKAQSEAGGSRDGEADIDA